MPTDPSRQVGIPVTAHTLLDTEALRQTALNTHAVSKRAVTLCAIQVFLSAPAETREAQMRSLLPTPSQPPLRSLALPLNTHMAISVEAARLTEQLNITITRGAVVVAAAHYYNSLPESTRPAAAARPYRRHVPDVEPHVADA